MEKQPHQEYRDNLADKLKEIRNSDTEKPEIAKAKAQGYLDAKKETTDYKYQEDLKKLNFEISQDSNLADAKVGGSKDESEDTFIDELELKRIQVKEAKEKPVIEKSLTEFFESAQGKELEELGFYWDGRYKLFSPEKYRKINSVKGIQKFEKPIIAINIKVTSDFQKGPNPPNASSFKIFSETGLEMGDFFTEEFLERMDSLSVELRPYRIFSILQRKKEEQKERSIEDDIKIDKSETLGVKQLISYSERAMVGNVSDLIFDYVKEDESYLGHWVELGTKYNLEHSGDDIDEKDRLKKFLKPKSS